MTDLLIVQGVDDYAEASRRILARMATGDLAGFDPDFGSAAWVAFWREHGKLLMEDVLTVIKDYERLRAESPGAAAG